MPSTADEDFADCKIIAARLFGSRKYLLEVVTLSEAMYASYDSSIVRRWPTVGSGEVPLNAGLHEGRRSRRQHPEGEDAAVMNPQVNGLEVRPRRGYLVKMGLCGRFAKTVWPEGAWGGRGGSIGR